MGLASERTVRRSSFIVQREYRADIFKILNDLSRAFTKPPYRFFSCKICAAFESVFDMRFDGIVLFVVFKDRINTARRHYRLSPLRRKRRCEYYMHALPRAVYRA